jgi:hypothetical protein
LIGQRPPAQAVAAAPPVPQPDRQAISAHASALEMQVAGDEAVAAINECQAKRLSGELKSFVQSAQYSNPRNAATSIRFG